MTHDELLAKINDQSVWTDNRDNGVTVVTKDWNATKNTKALRAVVEIADKDIEHESLVWLSGYCFAMEQVVQAIEKELG